MLFLKDELFVRARHTTLLCDAERYRSGRRSEDETDPSLHEQHLRPESFQVKKNFLFKHVDHKTV